MNISILSVAATSCANDVLLQSKVDRLYSNVTNGDHLFSDRCMLLSPYLFIKLTISTINYIFMILMFSKYVFLFKYRQIFCDFGEDFIVSDTNGEQPISNMIASVTKVNTCTA
jgi:hypothetical protein